MTVTTVTIEMTSSSVWWSVQLRFEPLGQPHFSERLLVHTAAALPDRPLDFVVSPSPETTRGSAALRAVSDDAALGAPAREAGYATVASALVATSGLPRHSSTCPAPVSPRFPAMGLGGFLVGSLPLSAVEPHGLFVHCGPALFGQPSPLTDQACIEAYLRCLKSPWGCLWGLPLADSLEWRS